MVEIPDDISIENLKIKRVRFVKEWGKKGETEKAYIVEIETEQNYYRELLSESELDLSIVEHKGNIEIQNENYMLFAKDFMVNDKWYEYPVIYGELDGTFDKECDYKLGGKYSTDDYEDFDDKWNPRYKTNNCY